MSKSAFTVGVVTLIVFGIAAVYLLLSKETIKNVPLASSGPILFFGDSLVEGVGATAGHDLPSILSRLVGEPVLNYGVSGDTTKLALARLSAAQSEKPKLVLVLLGGNDFLQKVPREETFSRLEKIIQGFQGDGAAVVLIGVRSGLVGGGADKEYETLAEKKQSRSISKMLSKEFSEMSRL